MKLTYFRKPASRSPEPDKSLEHKAPPEDGQPQPPKITSTRTRYRLQELREQVLRVIFQLASVLGTIAYLVNLPFSISQKNWISLAVFTFAIFIVLIMAVGGKRIPYNIRAIALLAMLYAVGIDAMFVSGLYGNGRVFLITLPLIATLLVGLRGRIVTLIVSIGSLVLFGSLMLTNIIPTPGVEAISSNESPQAWGLAVALFVLLSVMTTIILGVFLQNLEGSLDKQNELLNEIELERASLEAGIKRRTFDLERRLTQLHTAAEINRSLSTVLDIDQLIPIVCELLRERFGLYYVGAFLVDESGKNAVLAAGTGEAGKKMLAAHHKLVVGGDSMIGWATEHGEARIALDVGQEAVRFSNPNLPDTRSELAIPIIMRTGNVSGALTIQSSEPSAFDQDDIIVLQSVADSLATAIDNARLFKEVQTNLEEIRSLHRQYLARSWADVIASQGTLEYATEPITFPEEAPAGFEIPGETEELTQDTVRTLKAPIRLRDQVIGEITLEGGPSAEAGGGPIGWSHEDLQLIDAVTTQAGLAMENARLLDETQRRAEAERVSARISGRVWASSDIDTILRTTLQELANSLQATQGWIELAVEPTAKEANP